MVLSLVVIPYPINAMKLFYLLLLAALGGLLPAAAQTLDPTFAPLPGIYQPAGANLAGPMEANGQRLITGRYTRINGTAITSLARLTATGALDVAFQANLGTTVPAGYGAVGLPGGQYLLYYYYGALTAGGITRTKLLRLHNNGLGDASFNTGTGPTSTSGTGYIYNVAVQPNGQLLLVGDFDAFNGQPAPGIVRLTTTGSVDPTFVLDPALRLGTYLSGMAVLSNGQLLLAGNQMWYNNQLVLERVVRLNANGSRDLTYAAPALPGTVWVNSLVVQPNDQALLTCQHNLAIATVVPPLLRLQATGAPDPTFTADPAVMGSNAPNSTNYWQVKLPPNGQLLVLGDFPGLRGKRLVRLQANGALDATFTPLAGTNNTVSSVDVQPNGSILVGGYEPGFRSGEAALVQLTSTGALDPAFAPTIQSPGGVAAVARQPDGKLLLAGSFTELSGQAVHRVARLLPTGALDASFSVAATQFPRGVTSLALLTTGNVLVGTPRGLVGLQPGGSALPGFAPPALVDTAYIRALAPLANGRVLVSGQFDGSSGGATHRSLARLSATGALDAGFSSRVLAGPGLPETPQVLLVQADSQLVAAGYFNSSSSGAARLVRYSSQGVFDATFSSPTFVASALNPVNRAFFFALAQQPDGKLVVGGHFDVPAALTLFGLVRLTTAGAVDPTFLSSGAPVGTVVGSLAVQADGRILAGTTLAPPNTLSRLLSNGTRDASFSLASGPNGTPSSLLIQPDGALVLAGGFTSVNGQLTPGIARLAAPGGLATTPGAATPTLAVYPNPAAGAAHLSGAVPHALGQVVDALGRAVATFTTDATGAALLPAGLAPGVYAVRVGAATGRWVVQ